MSPGPRRAGGGDVAELANPLGDLLAGWAVSAQTGAAGRTLYGMGETAGEDTLIPVGVDFSKPSIARVYDALIGGKDNFAADRAMAQEMMHNIPRGRAAAIPGRARRVWRHRSDGAGPGPRTPGHGQHEGGHLPRLPRAGEGS